MDLGRITDKAWHITTSNALTGAGVDEGIQWLAEKLLERQSDGEGKDNEGGGGRNSRGGGASRK